MHVQHGRLLDEHAASGCDGVWAEVPGGEEQTDEKGREQNEASGAS